INIVWRANVICTYRKSGIARKTTVAYPELRLKEGYFMGKFAILATLFRKYFTEQRMFCNFAVYN
ncbi:hypothetical protein, partial [Prevotella sp.]|uniref:hypothetical protein n=1 Tax=Prevotella sp. TaxID=59823 RepID=UPI0025FCDBCF